MLGQIFDVILENDIYCLIPSRGGPRNEHALGDYFVDYEATTGSGYLSLPCPFCGGVVATGTAAPQVVFAGNICPLKGATVLNAAPLIYFETCRCGLRWKFLEEK